MHFFSDSLPVTRSAAGVNSISPFFIVKLHLEVVLHLGGPADLVQEIHVPGTAPELPVGDALKSDVLLQLHDGANRVVLDRPEFDRRDLVPGEARARIQEFWRTQQAADVIGAKRRSGGFHIMFLTFVGGITSDFGA